jgi:DNA polymerase (family 10)
MAAPRVSNQQIAAIFDEMADLLDIAEANPFRVRAYRFAARSVESAEPELAAVVAAGQALPHLAGVGHDLAEKIAEIASTGRCAALDALRAQFPSSLRELLQLPGIGPKRVKKLHDLLAISSIEDLRRAADSGAIRALPGFSEEAERHIREAIVARAVTAKRYRLDVILPVARALTDTLRRFPGVLHADAAGSVRRRRDMVGDLDLLVAAEPGGEIMQRFTGMDEVDEIVASGPTRSTVRLGTGLQVDLRVVPPHSYGAALVYFTGSKAHNIVLRRLGQDLGLKINEYGVFRGEERIAGETEESVYAAVGLPWIPPELREDGGEFAAARAHALPHLVERGDLRGDLHAHTSATDGRDGLADMARAARAAGLDYLAITDHSRRLTVAHGLDERRLAEQGEQIDRVNAAGGGATLLKGIEVDILEDGALDLPDSALAGLDVVVAAVHSHFNLPAAQQTDRILRAMDRPHFSILAHPSGRLLPDRPSYPLDMERIIRHAAERGCFLELNAQPERLDLTETWCRAAKEHGVLLSIGSDSHAAGDLRLLDFGIGQARRGWLEPKDVLNSRKLSELQRLLRGE